MFLIQISLYSSQKTTNFGNFPVDTTFQVDTNFQVDTTLSKILLLSKKKITHKNNMKSSSVNKSTITGKLHQKHSKQVHHYIKLFQTNTGNSEAGSSFLGNFVRFSSNYIRYDSIYISAYLTNISLQYLVTKIAEGKPLEMQYLTFISVLRDRKTLMHNNHHFHKANEFALLVHNNCISNVKTCSRRLPIVKTLTRSLGKEYNSFF